MKQWQFHSCDYGTTHRLYVMRGKSLKNTIVEARKSTGSMMQIMTPDDRWLEIHYKDLEFLDNTGQPLIEPVRDMTGRPIDIDTWVVYSVNDKASHALEIGKVQKIGPTGALTTKRILHNGNTIDPNKRWENQTSLVKDPWRALCLPVTESLMTTWVLKDFENLKRGE